MTKRQDSIQKIAVAQEDDFTTSCVLVYYDCNNKFK